MKAYSIILGLIILILSFSYVGSGSTQSLALGVPVPLLIVGIETNVIVAIVVDLIVYAIIFLSAYVIFIKTTEAGPKVWALLLHFPLSLLLLYSWALITQNNISPLIFAIFK